MSVKRGDTVRIWWDKKHSYQVQILATTKQGFRARWLDGPLEGREALIERSIVVHRGRPKKEKEDDATVDGSGDQEEDEGEERQQEDDG